MENETCCFCAPVLMVADYENSNVENLIPYFIEKKLKENKHHGYFTAYGMSMDLHGFTKLTQTLTKQGHIGAEQLSLLLNSIFQPLVRLIYRQGGFIPYYAGDAFTAIFPAKENLDSLERLLSASLAATNLYAEQKFFGTFQIGVKIGIGFGGVEWGIVGDDLKSFYFRGELIDYCAKSQMRAKPQEIVIHEHLKKQLPDFYQVTNIAPDYYLLQTAGLELTIFSPIPIEHPISPEVLTNFIPRQVMTSNLAGEFRTIVTVFISFRYVETHEELDRFVSTILESVQNFSGYFKEIDFGDKGGVIPIFFGAPISFENNAERAIEFTLSIKERVGELIGMDAEMRIGATVGTAFTGLIGCQERCQYAMVGNHVNLAARLMMFADWGEILVDEELQKARQFRFKHKGNIRYKGIEGDIPTYSLEGRSNVNTFSFSGIMMGRDEEMGQLIRFAEPILSNQPTGIIYIYGEAGIGKSRLAFELKNKLEEWQAISWFSCKSDEILRKGLNPFVYFLQDHFLQSSDATVEENRVIFDKEYYGLLHDLEQASYPKKVDLVNEIKRTKSILQGLLNISEEGSLWDQLDAKGRFQNIITALTSLFIAESLLRPTVLFLEDAHWFDDLSKQFLEDFLKRLPVHRILVLITSRYNPDDNGKTYLIEPATIEAANVKYLELDLNFLSKSAVRTFAMNKLKGTISRDFHNLLLRTTNGNPFYLEQVLEYFVESKLLIREEDDWSIKDPNIKLSNSINAILTARIDRLSSLVRETVKAAAVIGREFDLPVLSEVMREQEEFIRRNGDTILVLKEQIKEAEKGQIWQAMNELRYIFKHSLLREAVYGMQLRTRLKELHKQIAEAIEKLYQSNLKSRYFDLAFHYEQAEVQDKTDYYLRKAADYANRNFQNKQAIKYYGKLLGRIKDTTQRIDLLQVKGEILERIGDWSNALDDHEEALQLARTLNDKELLGYTNINYGNLLLMQGEYEDAQMYLEIGATFFEYSKDKEGMSKAYGYLGNLYFRQGQYEDAKAFYVQSIDLAKHSPVIAYPSFRIISNLGLTYMNQGNYEESIRWHEEGIQVAKKAANKAGLANLFTSVGIVHSERGDFQAALENYQQGLELSLELGDRQITAIATGCIGKVFERQGDYTTAMENYEKDLEICEELGDKQGKAIAYGLIGDLCSLMGEFDKAITIINEGLKLSKELGYQKGIAKAVNTLGDIYYYRWEYHNSLEAYNEAIEVTRKIENKLVLGFSLVEKGRTLLAFGNLQETRDVQEEAMQLSIELGNPDLIFEASILTIRLRHQEGNTKEATAMAEELLFQYQEAEKVAAVHYELHKIDPTAQLHRLKALELYADLCKDTPQYAFRRRIEILQRQ